MAEHDLDFTDRTDFDMTMDGFVSAGGVESVNNIPPDINGNVPLTAGDIPTATEGVTVQISLSTLYALVEALRRNAHIIVDTTDYPTLESFLASTGTEGYIYMYPIDKTDPDKGYRMFIWETDPSARWVPFGNTNEIDLSAYRPFALQDIIDAGMMKKTADSDLDLGNFHINLGNGFYIGNRMGTFVIGNPNAGQTLVMDRGMLIKGTPASAGDTQLLNQGEIKALIEAVRAVLDADKVDKINSDKIQIVHDKTTSAWKSAEIWFDSNQLGQIAYYRTRIWTEDSVLHIGGVRPNGGTTNPEFTFKVGEGKLYVSGTEIGMIGMPEDYRVLNKSEVEALINTAIFEELERSV